MRGVEPSVAAVFVATAVTTARPAPLETKYVEVAMVADAAEVEASGGVAAARQRLGDIAAEANRILEHAGLQPRVRLAVVEHQVFEVDPFQASTASGYAPDEALLVGFTDWTQGGLDQTQLDISVLITGQTLLASELGATRKGAVCWPGNNAALVRGGELSVTKSAEVLVHELGHMLGMGHDGVDNECAADDFLMRMVGGVDPLEEPKFSPCSQEEYQAQLNNSYISICVHDLPQVDDGVCGDGVKSAGEECDCGSAEDCSELDPCCDALTCKLVEGAVCSAFNDEASCCSVCQIAEKGSVCRAASGSCDGAETCTGFSSHCPGDTWPDTAGEPCVDEEGYDGACFAGRCQSGAEQCQVLGHSVYNEFIPPADECNTEYMECAYTHCYRLDTQSCMNVGQPAYDGTPCSVGMCQGGVCLEPDVIDECPGSGKTSPGVCGCDTPDDDVDGDGYLGCLEGCPNDANKVAPGACGCGQADDGACAEETGQGGQPAEEPDSPSAGGTLAQAGASSEPEDNHEPLDSDEVAAEKGLSGCGCRTASSLSHSHSSMFWGLLGLGIIVRRKCSRIERRLTR